MFMSGFYTTGLYKHFSLISSHLSLDEMKDKELVGHVIRFLNSKSAQKMKSDEMLNLLSSFLVEYKDKKAQTAGGLQIYPTLSNIEGSGPPTLTPYRGVSSSQLYDTTSTPVTRQKRAWK